MAVAVPRRLGELALLVGGRVVGEAELPIRGVASLEDAGPDELAFFHNSRYRGALRRTRAGAVVVSPADEAARPEAASLLVSDNPYLAFGRVSALFHPAPPPRAGRHPSAVLESADVDPSAEIGPLAYVGAGAKIGARSVLHPGALVLREAIVGQDCVLYPGAVVRERCVLGDRVILQPGAVVGSDGFGYAFDAAAPAHVKVPQAGIARLEDDVELGACACVDRATLGETVVGRGTKVDNLVQIAHNVRIGSHCLLCAQAGVAGSAELGNGVVLGGQVGVVGHLAIGDLARVGAQSGIMNDIPAGETWSGSPARSHAAWLRSSAAYWRLPELLKRLNALERKLERSEKTPAGG
ncbi:MAG: UDP-3-O-(3-hydroxymyristoyl)glucosamine N-acyltransferase [Deltaproteobacteria bacterium]